MATVSDYIIARLKQNNVDTLFGVPAVYCSAMYDAAARAAGFRAIVTASDLEAGYAADGYARVRGLSAVSVAYGVGTLSLINAVAGAYVERSPILVVNGGPSVARVDTQTRDGILFSHSMGGAHTDLVAFGPLTCWSKRVESAANAPAMIDDAIKTAIKAKHPAYIEFPQAVLGAQCPAPAGQLDLTIPAGTAAATAKTIIDAIRAANSPFLIVGCEIARYGLPDRMAAILTKLNIPWATTLLAKSSVAADKNFKGVFNGEEAPTAVKSGLAGADLIVSLGAVFSTGHAGLFPSLDVLMRAWDGKFVDKRKPATSVHIVPLVEALRTMALTDAPLEPDAAGIKAAEKLAEIAKIELQGEAVWDGDEAPGALAALREMVALAPPVGAGLSYDELFSTINEPGFLDASMRIVADTFLGIYSAARMTLPATDSFLAGAVWASIGHSVAAGLGASLAGGKRSVVICGDGGFQMMATSMSTMVREAQDVIIIVVDNGLYGYEQYLLRPSYYNVPAENAISYATLNQWDYLKVAEGMGVPSRHLADSVANLRTALAAAKAYRGGPSIIRAMVKSKSLPQGL